MRVSLQWVAHQVATHQQNRSQEAEELQVSHVSSTRGDRPTPETKLKHRHDSGHCSSVDYVAR